MKIGVCIKQVPDTTAKILVREDGTGIKEDGIKFVISPYDEFAVEEAIRLKEKNAGSEVIVFTFGPKRAQEALRSALAMGADRAVHITTENLPSVDSLSTAKVLTKALQKESVEILFTGRHAIDDDCAQVSQMIAEKLQWPHVTVVSKFVLEQDSKTATVERDVDGGSKEVWSVNLPAVFAASKGLNEPRYASLPGIMKAKSKPLAQMTVGDLGLSADDVKAKVVYSHFQVPSEERKMKIFKEPAQQAVVQVVKLLREEAKVI
jgi:electron transfer flavoprotein beta subunit